MAKRHPDKKVAAMTWRERIERRRKKARAERSALTRELNRFKEQQRTLADIERIRAENNLPKDIE